MKKIILFLNGAYPNNYNKIKELCTDRDIISVDGGTNIVYNIGLVPKKIVGDMDSIDKNILSYYENINVKTVKLFKEKDHTDFEVALLDYIPNKFGRFNNKDFEKQNFKNLENTDILVLGATGNRLDMTLSNLKKLHHISNMTFISENFEVIKYINKNTKFKSLNNKTFSIIPITDIKNMTLKGFKYSLNNNNISKDLGLVSNIVNNDTAIIEFEEGEMYIIHEM